MVKGFVRIALLKTEIEAQILSDMLKERHIAHLLQSYHAPANGSFKIDNGWGAILAAEEKKQEITDILCDLRREVRCCEECNCGDEPD